MSYRVADARSGSLAAGGRGVMYSTRVRVPSSLPTDEPATGPHRRESLQHGQVLSGYAAAHGRRQLLADHQER